jgi:hypothetical protein
VRRFESSRGHGPDLRTIGCGWGLVVVQGDADVDGFGTRLVADVDLEPVEQGSHLGLGQLVQPVGQKGKAVEQRGDTGKVGGLRGDLFYEDGPALLSFGDASFELLDALADPAAQCRGGLIGFEVDHLTVESPLQLRDLAVDLFDPFPGWSGAFRLDGSFEAAPPVLATAVAEHCLAQEPE